MDADQSLLSGPLSRRRLLGGLGLAGTGLALGGTAVASGLGPFGTREATADADAAANRTYPFYGDHQAGIVTPAQDRLAFAAMNVLDGTSRSDLRLLLRDWTVAAERMTRGQLVGDDTDLDDPPLDTGEAIGSPVGGLTVTIGYGPSLFDQRFGLAARKPALLTELPALPNEDLDPNYVGGDLCIQACSDDPLVAFHAVRNLARLGLGVVDYDWMELGFGKTSSTSTSQATPRTCSASRTAPATSKPSRQTSWTTTSGSGRTAIKPGCEVAATSSLDAFRSSSRIGTGTISRTSRKSSAGPR